MSEWGPWIEHDGKGCPCLGQYVHAVHDTGYEFMGIAGSQGSRRARSWVWPSVPRFTRVLRYRIRKPRGLTILEGLLENLPESVDA